MSGIISGWYTVNGVGCAQQGCTRRVAYLQVSEASEKANIQNKCQQRLPFNRQNELTLRVQRQVADTIYSSNFTFSSDKTRNNFRKISRPLFLHLPRLPFLLLTMPPFLLTFLPPVTPFLARTTPLSTPPTRARPTTTPTFLVSTPIFLLFLRLLLRKNFHLHLLLQDDRPSSYNRPSPC